jgi:heme-degrading monooxygenase HmoA
MITQTPKPPYFAVIFTSVRTNSASELYGSTAEKMVELATSQTGYLGHESARDANTKLGITVSYWQSLEAIKIWKQNAEHLIAQEQGRTAFYESYETRICRVERDYRFENGEYVR